jgi:choline dehydrogenase
VIVGAGSAGCALAARLSEDKNRKVLLLEAGGKDTNPWIHIPVGYFSTMHNPDFDWCFKTDGGSSGLGGRSIAWPRGKVLGGCSSINGLLAVHGQREDYDNWADPEGPWKMKGWEYKDCEEHFERLQCLTGAGGSSSERGLAAGDATRRSRNHLSRAFSTAESGPISLQTGERAQRKVVDAFLKACEEQGAPLRTDIGANSSGEECQWGAGYFQTTTRDSMRCSSAVGYLDQIRHEPDGRPNLDIVVGAHVHQVMFSSTSSKEAVGIKFSIPGSGKATYDARTDRANGGEVLLSAGAIGSPHILQLSGIGDGEHIRSLNPNGGVRHELPGVGQNLRDHLQIRTVYKTKNTATLNDELNNWPSKIAKGLEYFVQGTGRAAHILFGFLGPQIINHTLSITPATHTSHITELQPPSFSHVLLCMVVASAGPLSMAASVACAFMKTNPAMARPDVQFHFQPLSATTFKVGGTDLDPFSAVTASVCQLRPQSTGSVLARSTDPFEVPTISPNYLTHPEDQRTVIDSIKLARAICRDSAAMRELVEEEYLPGSDVSDDCDEAILAAARRMGESIYHPSGTCRMGRGDDNGAVVDHELRVHGVEGLRVVDCSVMPELVSGNTNLPTIMIAEKIAAEMKAAGQ